VIDYWCWNKREGWKTYPISRFDWGETERKNWRDYESESRDTNTIYSGPRSWRREDKV